MADIAVSGHKGGVGKTTTALHLAYFLLEALEGQSVLLIDYDSKNRSAVKRARTAQENGRPLPFPVLNEAESRRHIRHFDHVVHDLPGSPEENRLADICKGVDLMILPTGINDLTNNEAIVDVMDELDPARYRVLITMAPPRPQTDGEQLRAFFKGQGVPTFETIVRMKKVYNHAANLGQLVTKGQYEYVTREVISLLGLRHGQLAL